MREQGPDFPFHPKQLENWTQHMKQQFLDIEQQAMEDCDFWDKKQGEPYNHKLTAWKQFPSYSTGKRKKI